MFADIVLIGLIGLIEKIAGASINTLMLIVPIIKVEKPRRGDMSVASIQ